MESRVSDLEVAIRLTRTSRSAESRGIEFNMSFKKMKSIMNAKRCFITGEELTHDDPEDDNYLTMERLDSSKGYIDDNVVACGSRANKRKGDLTSKEIVQFYNALKKRKLI